MLVRDFAGLLRQLDGEESLSSEQRWAVNQLLIILAPHQDMELEALFDLFRKAYKPKRARKADRSGQAMPPNGAKPTASEFLSLLRLSMEDDATFARHINEAKSNRALTTAVLKQTFADLFGRSGNFRSKATREDVLNKIRDERNIKVRNDKMGHLLGRRPVPAE